MAFDWLPDPDAYEHPRLSWLIECGFEVAVRVLYRSEKVLPPDFRLHAGTLIVSNHQRESDVPILATALCRHDGVRILDPLPFFAMREDLLRRDALARLLWTWPRWIAQTLALIPLHWFFEAIRTRALRRVREFTLGETLEALIACGLGDAAPETVFNERGLREIAAQHPLPERVRDIEPGAAWRTYWGLRRLGLPALSRLVPPFRRTIESHLECLTKLLAAHRTLYIAPEGAISPDGRFGRVRAGAWEVCTRVPATPGIRPVALSYDALAPGRLRVVVCAGALEPPQARSRREFDAELRRRILALCPVTPSHLVARFLRDGPGRFAMADLADWLRRGRDGARDMGLILDPIWSRRTPPELTNDRLRWLRRKRLVERKGDAWCNLWPRDAAPGWGAPENIVSYLANSLEDFAPQFARALRP
ncbi:MAG TPA: hypothetical protein VJ722_06280 [Rhodanobacteraceae bacterium]|nr:hypothetical protein [Rhodanobacteraceae bacterium]